MFNSQQYWEERYRGGGNSGSGSYGRLAKFKAETINAFIEQNQVSSVIELGCGDGFQLSYMNYPRYIGLDVSKTAVDLCKKCYSDDPAKSFYLIDEKSNLVQEYGAVEMSVSLDVIYHLTEDEAYEKYMRRLFGLSAKYVCIYANSPVNPGRGGGLVIFISETLTSI